MNVDIVSGFLGAGKTTFLNRIIPAMSDEVRAKTVLIENEFGEAGIDGDLISGGLPVKELYAGCVCCTLKTNFQILLADIYREFNPECVLIEPSGVGQLSDVIAACENAEKTGVKLNIRHCITVIDAAAYFDCCDGFGDFYMDQVEHANLIVFSHINEISADMREKLFNAVRSANPKAFLYADDWFGEDSGFELAALLESLEHANHEHINNHENHENHEHVHDHNHEHEHENEILSSCSILDVKTFENAEAINLMLNELKNSEKYGKIFRGKGLVSVKSGGMLKFDFTPYHSGIEEFNNSENLSSRAVVIGQDLNEAELKKLFKN